MNAIHLKDVQLRRITPGVMVPGMSVDPLEQEEEETTIRLSLDLPASTVDFLERFSAYRNAMNEIHERPVKKWTRKSAAEAYVVAQVNQVNEQLAEMFATHGPIPNKPADVLAYAKAVLAAAEKSPKKR